MLKTVIMRQAFYQPITCLFFNNSYAPSNIPTDDVTSDKTIKTFSEHDTPENELEKLSYIYDENQDAYIKYNKDKSIINYLPNTKKILYCKKNNDNFTKVTYFYKANRIKIMINDYKIVEASYDFSNNSLECIDGDCENYKNKIKYIISVYKDLILILK